MSNVECRRSGYLVQAPYVLQESLSCDTQRVPDISNCCCLVSSHDLSVSPGRRDTRDPCRQARSPVRRLDWGSSKCFGLLLCFSVIDTLAPSNSSTPQLHSSTTSIPFQFFQSSSLHHCTPHPPPQHSTPPPTSTMAAEQVPPPPLPLPHRHPTNLPPPRSASSSSN